MPTTEIHIELLLGRRVLALNGRSIGRLEEMRTERIRNQLFVSEFLVGSYAVFERLSALSIGRAILGVLEYPGTSSISLIPGGPAYSVRLKSCYRLTTEGSQVDRIDCSREKPATRYMESPQRKPPCRKPDREGVAIFATIVRCINRGFAATSLE
jgi:hypothetical protein